LLHLRGGEAWQAAKFANPQAGATGEEFTDRGGKQANTKAEMDRML